MAEVAFTYNGSNELIAVCSGLTPSVEYMLFSNDAASSGDTGVADVDGNLTLTVSDIGGMSAGDTFDAEVYHSPAQDNPVACIVLKFGTSGSTDQGLDATWSYDGGGAGTGVVSIIFDSENGVDYSFIVNSDLGSVQTVTGDGTSKTLTVSTLDYGSATSFEAALYETGASPAINFAHRLFASGNSGSGFTGQAVPAFTAYATTSDLFRVLKVRDPSAEKIAAAQGDLDTATIEINGEIDFSDTHAALTTQELELVKGVCIDRAADLWRHRESMPGVLGIVDESIPATPGRYSWARYAARLSVLKDQWGIA